jgi:hypothetical protein
VLLKLHFVRVGALAIDLQLYQIVPIEIGV